MTAGPRYQSGVVEGWPRLLVLIAVVVLPLAIWPTRAMFTLPKAALLAFFNLFACSLLLYRWLALGVPLRKPRLAYAALAFGGLSALSALLSPYGHLALFGRYNSFEGLILLLEYVFAYFFAAQFAWSDAEIRRLSRAAAAAASIAVLYGAGQYLGFGLWKTESAFKLFRASSTMGNPVQFGVYLAAIWPLAAGLTLGGSRGERAFGYVASLIILVGLLLTFSRGAWLAWLSTAIILLVLGRRRRVWIWPAAAGTALAGLGLIALVLSNSIAGGDISKMAFSTASAESRGRIWRGGAAMIADRPLLGVGPDSFAWSYPDHQVAVKSNSGERIGDAHNYPLHLAATVGLPAALAFLALLAGTAGTALARLGPHGPGPRAFLALGLAGYFIAMLSGLSMAAYTGMAWLFMGMLDSSEGAAAKETRLRRSAAVPVMAFCSALAIGGAAVFAVQLRADRDYTAARQQNAAGDLAGAGADFARAAARGLGDNPYARDAALFYLEKARAARSRADLAAGVRLGEAAVARNRYDADNHNALSKLYVLGAKVLDPAYQRQAEREARLALKFNPYSAAANYHLGLVYLSGSRLAPAAEHFSRAASISPSPQAYLYLGLTYERMGLKLKARAAYDHALSLKPGWREAQARLNAL